MFVVDPRPDAGQGNGVVTRECPRCARRSNSYRYRAEYRDDEDEDCQDKRAAWRAYDAQEDVRNGLPERRVQDVLQIWKRSADRDDLFSRNKQNVSRVSCSLLDIFVFSVLTKNRPAMHPTGTANESARGSLTVASPHSSAIDVIMPMAEKLILKTVLVQIHSEFLVF